MSTPAIRVASAFAVARVVDALKKCLLHVVARVARRALDESLAHPPLVLVEEHAAKLAQHSWVAELLIPFGRPPLRCEVEQVPDGLEGANVAGILSGVGRCV